MGRTFTSTRQGVNSIAERWDRSSKKYRCTQKAGDLARRYSSEGFVGCNDGLESALFSAAMELLKAYPAREEPENPRKKENEREISRAS